MAIPSIAYDNGLAYSVISIGKGGFQNCKGLTSVIIGNSVETIGAYAFRYCSGLTSVIIGNSVETIGDSAFRDCYGLTSVIIPDSVETIGADAFAYCKGLTSVIIGNSVETIGAGAFYECSGLTSVIIGNSVETIGEYAFKGCDGLTSVIIPDSVETIGAGAFQGCKGLTSVIIGNSVETIGAGAFQGCKGLTSVIIPDSVKTIGNAPFSGCSGLVKSAYPTTINNPFYKGLAVAYDPEGAEIVDGWIYGPNRSAILFVPYTLEGEYVIPETVETIGEYAFSGCSGLTEVGFNENLVSIGDGAFQGCTVLTEVGFNENLVSFGDSAFEDCTALTEVGFNENLGSIGDGAFRGCTALTEVGFNENLVSIGDGAFQGCTALTEVGFNENLESIGDSAFSGMGATSVTIPGNVQFIGTEAFGNCSNLAEVVLSEGEKEISFGEDWLGNSPVKSLYIGRNFNTTFTCRYINSLVIGNTVTALVDNAFKGCRILETLTLGSNLVSIGANCFEGAALSEVVVSPSVETIGAMAFASNGKLESIIMGHNVKTIGEKAFDGCPASAVSITAQIPPTAPNNTFSNYTGKLYLQGKAAIDAYYDASTCWDRFNSYEMIEPTELKLDGVKNISGKPGDTVQLNATLLPDNVTLPQIFWRSTNPEIATVDVNGLVTIRADLSGIMTFAGTDAGSDNDCTIIAESLYANGPVAELNVNAIVGEVKVTDITLDMSELELVEGEEYKLTAEVKPENATDGSVTWSSSDESVASVKDGLVCALGAGVARITAESSNGLTAFCDVTVKAKIILVTEIILNPSSITELPGTQVQIEATVYPADATDATLEWTSSDESVARVDEHGVVTVVGEGSATVTAAATDGSGVQATCRVAGLAGIASLIDKTGKGDVYTVSGLLLRKDADSEFISGLAKGIYIIKISGKTYKVIK